MDSKDPQPELPSPGAPGIRAWARWNGRPIVVVAVLVVTMSAMFAVWSAVSPPPREPIPQGSAAPIAPPSPVAPPALPYKAGDGSIYTDRLFWGLKHLETSPYPTTPAQASAVLGVITLLERKLTKNQYLDEKLLENLLPAQREYIEARTKAVTADVMHRDFNPDRIHAIVTALETLAGVPRPTGELEFPTPAQTPVRPLTVSRMTSFMLAYDGMMADPTVAVGPEQAGRLLPYVDAYVRLKSMKQQTKRDILAILTTEQKSWIDEHPSRSDQISDMTRLTADVKSLMEGRAKEP